MLCRIPGLVAKLDYSWEGPYKIVKRVSAVNYMIHACEGIKRSGWFTLTCLRTFMIENLKCASC